LCWLGQAAGVWFQSIEIGPNTLSSNDYIHEEGNCVRNGLEIQRCLQPVQQIQHEGIGLALISEHLEGLYHQQVALGGR
jgi:hypothetical protein